MVRHRTLPILLALVALLWTSVAPTPAVAALSAGQLDVRRVVGGLSAPVGVTNAGDGSGRLFVVERSGYVRSVKGTTISATVFLDVHTKVLAGGERGLLGLAFHPDFATNRYVYAYYTRAGDGAIVVSRFTANSARTQAPSDSELILLVIPHPTYGNHNGGSIAFGPDGFLYFGTGDGGGSGDPKGNAQNKESLLGKILRIDVDGTGAGPNDAYAIPPSNPYVGKAGLDEIWARGLRNPWRMTFDRVSGAMFIGDVGQGRYEEIDRESTGGKGGRNYGWPILEGTHCYPGGTTCSTVGMFPPVAQYWHGSGGCSITGGYVYRGAAYPDLAGLYVFADYCSGKIWTMPWNGSTFTLRKTVDLRITSFGESESGELYFVTLGGSLYRVVAP